MLKRYLPKSLLGRSLLIIGMPLVLVQLISIWVFYDRHVDTVTRRMASTIVGEINLMMNHLQYYTKPADLVWITSEIQSNLNMRVTFKKGQKLGNAKNKGLDTLVGSELLRVFKQSMHRPFVIDAAYDPRFIKILVETKDGLLEIVTTKKRIRTITTDLFVMWSIGSSLILLIIAAIFMHNQVKPIRRLAHAADSFGKGRDVPDFKPYGAREVRRAATAFMIMRERLKRQMQQRTEMLAGISHDLRTPLTRFKLALAMMKGGPELEELERDVVEMEQLVDEYLAFARGEGSEQAVETNLPVLIEEVVNKSKREGLDLSFHTKGALRVMLRPNAFKRCLGNIIGNASRFADKIDVGASRRSGLVLVTVDDNGPGVPEENREDVFRPFFRAENASGSGGAGLGLTIARDVIRSHGGDIMLGDSPLGGLRVVIRLPV
jgi:two-component system osmolarity sensor histidine kinase EnvZ